MGCRQPAHFIQGLQASDSARSNLRHSTLRASMPTPLFGALLQFPAGYQAPCTPHHAASDAAVALTDAFLNINWHPQVTMGATPTGVASSQSAVTASAFFPAAGGLREHFTNMRCVDEAQEHVDRAGERSRRSAGPAAVSSAIHCSSPGTCSTMPRALERATFTCWTSWPGASAQARVRPALGSLRQDKRAKRLELVVERATSSKDCHCLPSSTAARPFTTC